MNREHDLFERNLNDQTSKWPNRIFWAYSIIVCYLFKIAHSINTKHCFYNDIRCLTGHTLRKRKNYIFGRSNKWRFNSNSLLSEFTFLKTAQLIKLYLIIATWFIITLQFFQINRTVIVMILWSLFIFKPSVISKSQWF